MQRIDDKDISITLYECDGNLAEVAQSLGTDSDTLSSYIRASTELQKAYAVAVDYVRSVALRNVINSIKGGDVDASRWWLERCSRLVVDDDVLPFQCRGGVCLRVLVYIGEICVTD